MGLLSSAELVNMQAEVQSTALPDTCTILSATRTSNGQGGYTNTWGTVSSSVACRLDFVTGNELTVAVAIQPATRWMLNLPYGTTVLSTYRFVHNTNTYAAVADPNSDASWATCVQVLVEKVN